MKKKFSKVTDPCELDYHEQKEGNMGFLKLQTYSWEGQPEQFLEKPVLLSSNISYLTPILCSCLISFTNKKGTIQ